MMFILAVHIGRSYDLYIETEGKVLHRTRLAIMLVSFPGLDQRVNNGNTFMVCL